MIHMSDGTDSSPLKLSVWKFSNARIKINETLKGSDTEGQTEAASLKKQKMPKKKDLCCFLLKVLENILIVTFEKCLNLP